MSVVNRRVDQYLSHLLDKGGSDLHLPVGSPPMIRVDGDLKATKHPPLSPKETYDMVVEILDERQRKSFSDKKDIDFSYEIPGLSRFRANAYVQRKGIGLVFRAIPNRIQTIEELGFPASVEGFTERRRGIILVTGPGGCGKSTTQAALIDRINGSRKEHIITVEDPIEFIHKDKKCLVNQREVGYHTNSFAIALRQALRQDPDVILVGEMRDLDTVSMAITAAETGHLVIGTLHTINAMKSIDRIIDVFPGDQRPQIRVMVAESIVGVISQQLVKVKDGKGRVAVSEVLVGTVPVGNLIRDAKTFQLASAMQMGRKHGMQLMDESLLKLFKGGKIDFDTALSKAEYKEDFQRMARKG